MKNKITDLNNHLFAQIERLSDEDITEEQLEREIKRTDAIVDVSEQIINNASLALKATELVTKHGVMATRMMPMIEGPKEPKEPNYEGK
jgi:hypothetical protein